MHENPYKICLKQFSPTKETSDSMQIVISPEIPNKIFYHIYQQINHTIKYQSLLKIIFTITHKNNIVT